MKANNGDFFVDSHASDPWGAPEELWSSNMAAEFQSRAGYDLDPEPPGAVRRLDGEPRGTFFSFSDGSAPRIRSDFNQVRSTLYTQNRLVAFQNWAHTYNMKLRLQQEDIPTTSSGDQIETSLGARPLRARVADRLRSDRHLPADGVGQPHERQHLVLDRVLRGAQREQRADGAGRDRSG